MRSLLPCRGREVAADPAIRLSSATALHLQMLDITAQNLRHHLLFVSSNLSVDSNSTGGNAVMLHQGKFRVGMRKGLFSERLISEWNQLPSELVIACKSSSRAWMLLLVI